MEFGICSHNFDIDQYFPKTLKMKSLVILAAFFSVSLAFRIIDYEPKNATIKEEDQDRSVVLSCKASDDWHLCEFSHNGESVCKIEGTHGYEAEAKDCDDDVEYIGGYEDRECKLNLTHVEQKHAGRWTCRMTDWDTRKKIVSQQRYGIEIMKIQFIPNPTKAKELTTTEATGTATATTSMKLSFMILVLWVSWSIFF